MSEYEILKEVIVKESQTIKVSLAEYIGLRIEIIRKEKGFNQLSFSEKISINRTTLSNIESGKQNTTIKTLEEICKFLECDSSDILPF